LEKILLMSFLRAELRGIKRRPQGELILGPLDR
jgi:hypothetical protein